MEAFINALITTLFFFGPAGLAILYARSLSKGLKEDNLELAEENKLLASNIEDLRLELDLNSKNLAHAISELHILKGGVMENDDLIDTLFQREKFLVDELNSIRTKTKVKKPSAEKLMKKSIKTAKRKMPSPKDMVFNLTRRSK